MRYITDFNPETETFSLNDIAERCVIVITKEQLESLIALYRRCYE